MAVRSKFRISTTTLTILVLASLARSALAQQSFLIDAGPCLALAGPVERLACFEDQVRVAQSLQPVAPAAASGPAAPAIPSAPATAQSPAAPQAAADNTAAFGLRAERKDAKPEELLATVAGLREFSPGQLSITLTNGQIWRQTRAERYNLREGHEVRIYPTRWGNNFRLSAKGLGGFIQVERVE